MALQPHLSGRASVVVGTGDTAVAVGSGDVPVLATPCLLAVMEEACCDAVAGHVEPDKTTVSTRVQLEHLAASPLGARLTAQSRLAHVDGRLLRFEVIAEDDTGRLVGHGQVTRTLVDRETFLARAGQSGSA